MDTLPHHAQDDNSPYITIPLNKGYSAIVDPEDGDLSRWRWHVNKDLYAIHQHWHNGKNEMLTMHRIILERKLGYSIRAGMHVDHINGNVRDNRRENLREVTPSQNAANRRHKNVPRTSQYKGVCFKHGKWEANIGYQGKVLYLGTFNSEEMAAQVYDQAALELYGEYAATNNSTIQLSLQSVIRKPRQPSKVNTSGFTGVSKWRAKWKSAIYEKGVFTYLGVFEDKTEAARAYDMAAIALRGRKAKTNFPYEDYEARED